MIHNHEVASSILALATKRGFGLDLSPFFVYLVFMDYYVYMLYSQSKDRYYVGYSHNPDERLAEHNLGATTSTRPGRPWILVYTEKFSDKSSAIKREAEIKKMKNRIYIENLIKRYPGILSFKCEGSPQLHRSNSRPRQNGSNRLVLYPAFNRE